MLEEYVIKNNRKMRMGYTTGSCAAAASKAAAEMLLSGKTVPCVRLMTPKGIELQLEVLGSVIGADYAECAIRKDGGDDPDATNGLLIYSRVELLPDTDEIQIDGGPGVGRVTKKGLEQPVGAAAINRVPRSMIRQALTETLEKYGEKRGAKAVISIPGGEETAQKTFNPRLGIVGGLSVLGTSGIVEPMSEAALISSIQVEINMRLANGKKYLILVPGNYGIDFLTGQRKELLGETVKCSNYMGEALDTAAAGGAEGVLLIGHIGKFVKLAGGIMNTHSRNADARMEIITAHAAVCGADSRLCRRLMECVTTDDALEVLQSEGLDKAVMERLIERMEFYVNKRCYDKPEVGIITFSNRHGMLGMSEKAEKLLQKLEEQEKQCGQQL